MHSLVQGWIRFGFSHVGGHAVPHWLYSIRRGHCLDDTFSKRKFAPMLVYTLIACCYGVARFIVQNKQATTLWSGSRDLYRV